MCLVLNKDPSYKFLYFDWTNVSYKLKKFHQLIDSQLLDVAKYNCDVSYRLKKLINKTYIVSSFQIQKY